jgi:hypothetical protein
MHEWPKEAHGLFADAHPALALENNVAVAPPAAGMDYPIRGG